MPTGGDISESSAAGIRDADVGTLITEDMGKAQEPTQEQGLCQGYQGNDPSSLFPDSAQIPLYLLGIDLLIGLHWVSIAYIGAALLLLPVKACRASIKEAASFMSADVNTASL